jgi:prophage regulatory protein
MNEILRTKAVQQAVGLSKSTLWRLCRDGKFPARRRLSTNSVGWLRSDIAQWIQSRAIVTGGSHGN